jgi:acyl-CoA synthetase
VFCVTSPLTFDPSIVELFLPMAMGASVVFLPTSVIRAPRRLFTAIKALKVTALSMTPSLFSRFDTTQVSEIVTHKTSVNMLMLGGEQFPPSLARVVTAGQISIDIWNVYGTTECSVWAFLYQLQPTVNYSKGVPIGEPLRDTSYQICLDDERNEELWIGGIRRQCFVGTEDDSAPL